MKLTANILQHECRKKHLFLDQKFFFSRKFIHTVNYYTWEQWEWGSVVYFLRSGDKTTHSRYEKDPHRNYLEFIVTVD